VFSGHEYCTSSHAELHLRPNYVFELYALSAMLDLPADATRKQLLDAMRDIVVGKAAYVGRFRQVGSLDSRADDLQDLRLTTLQQITFPVEHTAI
jgi:hypothetical protein